jgi:hypothetical protein
VPVDKGGTGSNTVAGARANIGAASASDLSALSSTVGAKPDYATEMPMSSSDSTKVSAAIATIDNKIGSTTLPTTAQTLTGAIDEHESDISSLSSKFIYLGTMSGETIEEGVKAACLAYKALNFYDTPCPVRFAWGDNYVGVMCVTVNWVKFHFSSTNDIIYGDYHYNTDVLTLYSLNSNTSQKRDVINTITSDTYIMDLLPGTYNVNVSADTVTNGFVPERWGTLTISQSSVAYCSCIFISTYNTIFFRIYNSSNKTWYGAWQELTLNSKFPNIAEIKIVWDSTINKPTLEVKGNDGHKHKFIGETIS